MGTPAIGLEQTLRDSFVEVAAAADSLPRMPDVNSEQWLSLMQRMNLPEHREVFLQLVTAYAEPHRHYHTAKHIGDCLEQLHDASGLAREPEEVELAIWFHDAVYVPRSKKNELESAQWAERFLRNAGVGDQRCRRVSDHIMATCNDGVPSDDDAMLVVDVDLSILGSCEQRYQDFEIEIRREYASVPRLLYRRGRRNVLESFLSRPQIYGTRYSIMR